MAKTYLTLGEWIRERRESRGLTQRQIGEAMGLRPNSVGYWESGVSKVKLTPSQFDKLGKLLGVSFEDFLEAEQGKKYVEAN